MIMSFNCKLWEFYSWKRNKQKKSQNIILNTTTKQRELEAVNIELNNQTELEAAINAPMFARLTFTFNCRVRISELNRKTG